MADDVDVNADEGVVDKDGESVDSEGSEAKPGFLKSKLFKIIVGVVLLLLIAGGAYFFLAPKDAPEDPASETLSEEIMIEDDTTSPDESDDDTTNPDENDIDEIDTISDLDPTETPASDTDELLEAQKAAAALQEENARMQQQINDLTAQVSQKEKLIQDQQDNPGATGIAPIRNLDSIDYQQDYFSESSMREPSRTPPPKPSWGEFDRINKR